MKSVTASEARKNWFKLLDEVAKGEVVAIQRNDKRIILAAERTSGKRERTYKGLIRGRDLENADKWSWTWDPQKGLRAAVRK